MAPNLEKPSWLHHRIHGLIDPEPDKSSTNLYKATRRSHSVRNNTMHSCPFFHGSLCEYGNWVTMETQEL